ncbi:MAG: 30S ribosomal protein S15 [Candidatus Micrarchaeota archaeon]|nr:30S ribosomal protein S15 [Candidatus Micrarchaeota archaeon]
MARMHSKKHGKAKSVKPVPAEVTAPQLSNNQIEELIIGYAKQGISPAMIGEKLKREHGVQYVKQALGKRLVTVLKEKKLSTQIPSDMLTLMKKAVNLHSHLSTNGQDVHNRVRLMRIEAKIWRLTKYYIREGVLPATWRYDPKQAELIIKGAA